MTWVPRLFMISWKEQNGQEQLHKFRIMKNEIIYSNWTTPDGEFKNLKKGQLKKMNLKLNFREKQRCR